MAVAADDDGLTDYERQRLAHVARNREYMARLGVLDLAKVVATEKPTTAPSRKRVKREPTEPSRRSGRLLNVKPEHDGSAVDALRDDEDAGERRNKRTTGRIATGPAGDASVWDSEDAALEASRQWLEDARALMLARTSAVADMPKGSRSEEATRARWRKEAVSRWGDGVPAIDAVKDWERWVKSRVGAPPPPSDLQLLQEYYAHDAWQLLVACVLMSRVRSSSVRLILIRLILFHLPPQVSSWDVKHNTISAFFAKYPTPTHALAASPNDVLEVIRPLGLFPARFRSIVEVSTKVVSDVGEFDVGPEPTRKVYGVGEFGIDSFEVFVRGDLARQPADKTLQSFVSWQKRRR